MIASATIILIASFVTWQRADDPPDSRSSARTPPLLPAEQQRRFHLPPGFEIELVAAEPAVRKPVNINFDAAGRIFVTCSREYPFPAATPQTRDLIQVVFDADLDGRYDSVENYADNLNIPVGITPVGKQVIAFSIPHVLRFVDQDGDGQAELRERVLGVWDARDTHGLPNAFNYHLDGWIYGCQGESNRSVVTGRHGDAVTLRGGATFRFRPDGSCVEHFSHGQTNPFGLCFDPLGNLYTADSHSKPAYQVLRGAFYPATSGTVHDGLGFGPTMMQHFHESTGIAGISYYADDRFPPSYRDGLFIGNPVTGRINHDRIAWMGSSPRGDAQPDFLTCDDPWFRPVDLKLGPDGALYIADFYSPMIAHSLDAADDARRDRSRGRIWRIVYVGTPAASRSQLAPNLADAPLTKLIEYLRHPNLVVRTHATHELADRVRQPAIEPLTHLLESDGPATPRVHAIWVFHRLDQWSPALADRLTSDSSAVVRVHVQRVLAERADRPAEREHNRRLSRAALRDADPMTRRAAAEALGRYPTRENIEPLLALWAETPPSDSHLTHVVRMALRDTVASLDSFPTVPADATDRMVEIALGVPNRHAAIFLQRSLMTASIEAAQIGAAWEHAIRFADPDTLRSLIQFATGVADEATTTRQRRMLRAIYHGYAQRGQAVPPTVAQRAIRLAREQLHAKDDQLWYAAVEFVWELKLRELAEELVRFAVKSSPDAELRRLAIDALADVDPPRAVGVAQACLLDATEPLELRQKAASALGKIQTPESLKGLDDALGDAPLRLATTIAQQLSHTPSGSELLVTSVERGRAPPDLLRDPVVEQLVRLHAAPTVLERRNRVLATAPAADGSLAEQIERRRGRFAAAVPESRRGAEVFQRRCSVCHAIGGKGSPIGPALDGIGTRGLDRILEDLLDPNRVVDARYRASVLALKNGRVARGLITGDEPNQFVLVDSDGRETRIQKGEVEMRGDSALSPMPNDLAGSLTETEFFDLLAFLLVQRARPSK